MRIQVECAPEHAGEAAPRRFYLGRNPVEVVDVIDRWPGHDHQYYKVQGDDGSIYILKHDTVEWVWNLTMFASRDAWNR